MFVALQNWVEKGKGAGNHSGYIKRLSRFSAPVCLSSQDHLPRKWLGKVSSELFLQIGSWFCAARQVRRSVGW
jgi:hypothetical protein